MKIRFIVKDNENQPVEGAKVDIKYGLVDTILLTMDPLKRFNNVEGELTVNYDAVKGSLSGRGGAVESFTETFTPTDLVPKPNPGIAEAITSIPSINTAFAKVAYNNRYASDYIVAKSPSITVVFINVDDINL